METIPEVIKKNDLKLSRLSNTKEKKSKKLRNNPLPSENDRNFLDQILKREAENTMKKFILKPSKSEILNSAYKGRRSLKVINLSSNLAFSVYSNHSSFVSKSESQERKGSKTKKKTISRVYSPVKLGSTMSLLKISVSNRHVEGILSYFVGPGNNDLLIRKIMKKKRNWVKVPIPHTANFIWTQVRKTGILELLSKGWKAKKINEAKKTNSDPPVMPITRLYNRLDGNFELTTKKKLFFNMFGFYKSLNLDPFKVIPLTFHFSQGKNDLNLGKFCAKFQEIKELMPQDKFLNNLWVIKPGEATNRGFGISVSNDLNEICMKISEKLVHKSQQRTFIVQKYIYRPLLYRGRKFDIRCYALVSCIDNQIQAYFYKDGYLRTSCQVFNTSDLGDRFVHLTNDAVQKNSANYGCFEDSNKLSYQEFQEYLDETMTEKINFKSLVLPKIRSIVKDTVSATYYKLNPSGRIHTFEILGYDFMLDEFFTPWLIEVNTNPCLELSGWYLKELIPEMVSAGLNLVTEQVFGKDPPINGFEQIFTQV